MTPKYDVWMIGCLAFEMIFGRPPPAFQPGTLPSAPPVANAAPPSSSVGSSLAPTDASEEYSFSSELSLVRSTLRLTTVTGGGGDASGGGRANGAIGGSAAEVFDPLAGLPVSKADIHPEARGVAALTLVHAHGSAEHHLRRVQKSHGRGGAGGQVSLWSTGCARVGCVCVSWCLELQFLWMESQILLTPAPCLS